MSEVKVNKITPTTNCGTVTLGDSGDTIAIASGVTLSNSGSITNSGTITNTGTISGGTITGTIDNQVNWDTTAKTTGFTAVAGNGYFVNTTSGAITVTLPATPSAGDLVGIKDYAGTANTNNITLARNGSNIQGTANDFIINVTGLAITLIYVDGTQGWVSTGAAQASNIETATFIVATGGTITCCGDYKIHTFTGPGTFAVSSVGNCLTPAPERDKVNILVIGGGGGGASRRASGGGAGGYRFNCSSTVTVTSYPISIGAGGAGHPGPGTVGNDGCSGSPSSALSITSTGGGFGATQSPEGGPGGTGGSGGGGFPGGAGNTPSVSPSQGNPGGDATGIPDGRVGAGGGGAGAPGANGSSSQAGAGGAGSSAWPGDATTRAGGGGAGAWLPNPAAPGAGGSGGGGAGGAAPNGAGVAGTANTGGGGGGGACACGGGAGGSGGSGVVIIKYKFQ